MLGEMLELYIYLESTGGKIQDIRFQPTNAEEVNSVWSWFARWSPSQSRVITEYYVDNQTIVDLELALKGAQEISAFLERVTPEPDRDYVYTNRRRPRPWNWLK